MDAPDPPATVDNLNFVSRSPPFGFGLIGVTVDHGGIISLGGKKCTMFEKVE